MGDIKLNCHVSTRAHTLTEISRTTPPMGVTRGRLGSEDKWGGWGDAVTENVMEERSSLVDVWWEINEINKFNGLFDGHLQSFIHSWVLKYTGSNSTKHACHHCHQSNIFYIRWCSELRVSSTNRIFFIKKLVRMLATRVRSPTTWLDLICTIATRSRSPPTHYMTWLDNVQDEGPDGHGIA